MPPIFLQILPFREAQRSTAFAEVNAKKYHWKIEYLWAVKAGKNYLLGFFYAKNNIRLPTCKRIKNTVCSYPKKPNSKSYEHSSKTTLKSLFCISAVRTRTRIRIGITCAPAIISAWIWRKTRTAFPRFQTLARYSYRRIQHRKSIERRAGT